MSRTVDSLIAQYFVPVTASYFCILDAKEKESSVPCIRKDQTYPVIGEALLSGRVWLLAGGRSNITRVHTR